MCDVTNPRLVACAAGKIQAMTTAHVFGLLGVVVIIVLPAFLAARIARCKGRPFWLYLVAGLLVGPLALLAAVLLRGRGRLA
jgi:uncharacterized membrane protein YdcZ (DUF606 family)